MSDTPTPQCVKRLQKELSVLSREPNSFFITVPSSKSILIWYFVLHGPSDTPYDGGRYLGKLNFPPEYPMKPPDIFLLTPNGRFQTNKSICLTMSSYHPEQWSPLWGVRTILTGLLSFMVEEELTTGGLTCSDEMRRKYARESRRFNVEQMKMYKELFPSEYQSDLEFLKSEEESRKQSLSIGRDVGGPDSYGGNVAGNDILELQERCWRGLCPALLGLFLVMLGSWFFLLSDGMFSS